MSKTSQLRTEVSFRSLPAGSRGPEAARDLAQSLANALRAEGFTCSDPEDIDYGFAFRCRVSRKDFYMLVGYVGDGVREWLISATTDLGWLRRLFGYDDEQERRQLTAAIHNIVSSSDDLENVRWYTLDEWNNDPDESWSTTPGA